MAKTSKCDKGFLTTELIVSMAIIGLIIVGLTVSLSGFGSFNDLQWARQRCLAAAQAQLDSITATGTPLSPDEMVRLWGRAVDVSVASEPGEGQWQNLTLVRVTASAQPGPRRTTVHLARYVRARPALGQGG